MMVDDEMARLLGEDAPDSEEERLKPERFGPQHVAEKRHALKTMQASKPLVVLLISEKKCRRHLEDFF